VIDLSEPEQPMRIVSRTTSAPAIEHHGADE
jgi:hypothetical protein